MSSSSFGFGVAAAVAAPLVMAIGFIFWDNHWKGSTFALNLFKCNLASIGFLIASLLLASQRSSGLFFASSWTVESVGFLMLSGLIGIIIGDYFWLEGLRLLGAQRVILVDALKPFTAALMGYLLLGESLRVASIGGIFLTVAGVGIVSFERSSSSSGGDEGEDSDGDEKAPRTNNNTESSANVTDIKSGCNDELTPTTTRTSTSSLPPGSTIDATDAISVVDVEEELIHDEEKASPGGSPSATDYPAERLAGVDPPKQDSQGEQTTPKDTPSRQHRGGSLRENRTNTPAARRNGYMFAFLNVVLDTYGSVLTKQHGGALSTWEISLVRFGFAGLVMLVISCIMMIYTRLTQTRSEEESVDNNNIASEPHEQDGSAKAKDDKPTPWYWIPTTNSNMTSRDWIHICVGVGLVTFLTPALSNYALFQIALALALTLASVGPLYALVLTWWLQQDVPTVRASLGAVVAVAGVVVLSLFGK